MNKYIITKYVLSLKQHSIQLLIEITPKTQINEIHLLFYWLINIISPSLVGQIIKINVNGRGSSFACAWFRFSHLKGEENH